MFLRATCGWPTAERELGSGGPRLGIARSPSVGRRQGAPTPPLGGVFMCVLLFCFGSYRDTPTVRMKLFPATSHARSPKRGLLLPTHRRLARALTGEGTSWGRFKSCLFKPILLCSRRVDTCLGCFWRFASRGDLRTMLGKWPLLRLGGGGPHPAKSERTQHHYFWVALCQAEGWTRERALRSQIWRRSSCQS